MTSQNHPRRSLFAVWRWPRWVKLTVGLLVLASIAFYPFSLPPALFILYKTKLDTPTVMRCFGEFYAPVIDGIRNSDEFCAINAWEWDVLTKVFGMPQRKSRFEPDNPFR